MTPTRPMGYNAAQRVNEAEQSLEDAVQHLRRAMDEQERGNGLKAASCIGRAFGEVNAALLALHQAKTGE